MKRSAGIVLYRRLSGCDLEVLLGHMGGPYWARKDAGAWTIPKGEIDDGEDPLQVARREFHEEVGVSVPAGDLVDLGEVRQAGGKVVHAWAVEGDLDPAASMSNTFELEWPPKSGRFGTFPELDRVAWFELTTAVDKIIAGQRPFLDRITTGVGPAT